MRGAVPTGDAFGVLVYDDAENCKGPRPAGAGNSARNPTHRAVGRRRADHAWTSCWSRPTRESCLLRWSFTLVGRQVVLGQRRRATARGCRAALLTPPTPTRWRRTAGPRAPRRQGQRLCAVGAGAIRSAPPPAQGGQDQGAAVLRPGANADDLQGLIGAMNTQPSDAERFVWPMLLAGFGHRPARYASLPSRCTPGLASVWRVVTYDADNLPLGQGSGVVVGSEAIVTNCHVLAKAKRGGCEAREGILRRQAGDAGTSSATSANCGWWGSKRRQSGWPIQSKSRSVRTCLRSATPKGSNRR